MNSKVTIPEWLIIASLLGLIGAIPLPIFFPGPCEDPKKVRTRVHMHYIYNCMLTYRNDTRSFPTLENWKSVLMPCLQLQTQDTNPLLDGWDRPIELDQNSNGQYVLRSLGRNGIDDQDKYDDITREVRGSWGLNKSRN